MYCIASRGQIEFVTIHLKQGCAFCFYLARFPRYVVVGQRQRHKGNGIPSFNPLKTTIPRNIQSKLYSSTLLQASAQWIIMNLCMNFLFVFHLLRCLKCVDWISSGYPGDPEYAECCLGIADGARVSFPMRMPPFSLLTRRERVGFKIGSAQPGSYPLPTVPAQALSHAKRRSFDTVLRNEEPANRIWNGRFILVDIFAFFLFQTMKLPLDRILACSLSLATMS